MNRNAPAADGDHGTDRRPGGGVCLGRHDGERAVLELIDPRSRKGGQPLCARQQRPGDLVRERHVPTDVKPALLSGGHWNAPLTAPDVSCARQRRQRGVVGRQAEVRADDPCVGQPPRTPALVGAMAPEGLANGPGGHRCGRGRSCECRRQCVTTNQGAGPLCPTGRPTPNVALAHAGAPSIRTKSRDTTSPRAPGGEPPAGRDRGAGRAAPPRAPGPVNADQPTNDSPSERSSTRSATSSQPTERRMIAPSLGRG